MLGLGTKDEPKAKNDKKKDSKKSDKSSDQSDEAKKVLEQMEAKKESEDCPFC